MNLIYAIIGLLYIAVCILGICIIYRGALHPIRQRGLSVSQLCEYLVVIIFWPIMVGVNVWGDLSPLVKRFLTSVWNYDIIKGNKGCK